MAAGEKQLIALLTSFKDEIVQSIDHRMGIVQEDIQHKLDLIVEGQQSLVDRMDRFEGRMSWIENRLERVEVRVVAVDKKVDLVPVYVTAHRRDTEAHR